MRINEVNPEFLRPDQIKDGRAAGEGTVKPTQPPEPVGRVDKVEISAAGRALTDKDDAAAGLSPERIAEIRQRITDGTYNSPEVVDALARSILTSGDV